MEESLKKKTVKGTVWSSIERFSVQAVQFVVLILMARILTPSDYGLVGMITIFISVSQTLIDSGFSSALIRKNDRTEIDNSTVFYFNIGVGIILYLILFFCAPFIARFYNEPLLVPITRLVCLSILVNSFIVVQIALLSINLNFKTQAKASLTAALTSGAVGLSMAYTGWGVWAIVGQQLTNVVTNCGLLWILTKWRPAWVYSWKSFRELFSFGSKMLASGLIDSIYRNLYLLVIGKIFKASDLGYYTRAQNFSTFASSNITGIFQRVSYPVLCTIQDDDQRLSDVYRKILRTSAYVIFPLMCGLAAIANPMIFCILTEKWMYAAVLLVPISLAGMWYPVHAINLNLLQVKGRSDLFLRLEIYKKLLGVAIIAASIPFGLYVMCWGSVIGSLTSLIINTHYTGKLINIGFFKQMKDLFPILLLSLGTGVAVWLTVNFLNLNPWLLMFIGIAEGIILYIVFSILFRFNEYKELIDIIRRR